MTVVRYEPWALVSRLQKDIDRLFSAPSSFGTAAYATWDVAADNRFLFVGPPNPGRTSRFNVVVNWQAALKK